MTFLVPQSDKKSYLKIYIYIQKNQGLTHRLLCNTKIIPRGWTSILSTPLKPKCNVKILLRQICRKFEAQLLNLFTFMAFPLVPPLGQTTTEVLKIAQSSRCLPRECILGHNLTKIIFTPCPALPGACSVSARCSVLRGREMQPRAVPEEKRAGTLC